MPSIVHDMPERDYHAHQSDSASRIETFIRRGRREYKAERDGERVDAPTEQMGAGRYFHAGFLEPATLAERFAVEPSRLDLGQARPGDADALMRCDARKKAGKDAMDDFRASLGKRSAVDPWSAACLAAMLQGVADHPEAGGIMFPVDAGQNEVSLFWEDEETGRPMRCRLDRMIPERLLCPDLKTADHDASLRAQVAMWHRFGYHRKAAIYLDGLYALTGKAYEMPFVFVTVHPKRPRVWVRWARLDTPSVMVGRQEYRKALHDIIACEESGEWREPHELEREVPLELPSWAVSEAISGMAISGVEGA